MQKQLENISIDDSVLVQRCQEGDSAAMQRLIVKYQDRIFNVILKICGNTDDAAELTQETFVRFIERINTFQRRSSFYTWLFRIAVNLTYNHCKRKVKLGVKSLDMPVGPEYENAAVQLRTFLTDTRENDPVSIAQNKEIIQIVQCSLGKLDDDQRIVLILRDIEGMTYAEISQALELELGTVKSRISRARKNLKEILEEMLE